MSSIVPLAMMQWNQNVITYFRNKKALSPQSAIIFNQEEFEKMFNFYLTPNTSILKQPYIKTNNSGAYYIDEDVLKIYSAKSGKIGLIMVAVSIFILVIGYIFVR
ncbi:hypothetical protein CO180_03360 [candidate division WWE3 bacterium CG_4_9_14_3_um_filter_41_6]|uniref:Uncharacterized protein n=1 Tax=candidate division WWE3 bacterium CG_4_10_14_0_2_um_filter_41_14 TaxID=1975072 RepID=A0A2M7TMV1_UNCKA|nr:MAG: hypothetical protein COY32_00235 [candidate division WWE3 bacterium CG_4_10_14_0_2_um_filter_41_14]PJA38515.1 MAG: hypothetical protein CO180_03360 [candidate division WWE3 bacterium CG_4_9_14_3_um_filter_41_6]